MRALIIAAVLLAAFPAVAKPRAPKPPAPLTDSFDRSCVSDYAHALGGLSAALKDKPAVLYPIESADAGKFLAIFNSAEPKTDFKADTILIVSLPKYADIAMFIGGCLTSEGKIAPTSFDAMMIKDFGSDTPDAVRL
jgi:hypothetical protein